MGVMWAVRISLGLPMMAFIRFTVFYLAAKCMGRIGGRTAGSVFECRIMTLWLFFHLKKDISVFPWRDYEDSVALLATRAASRADMLR